jgi:NAD(P)-dependent dehydrogenase (short-subunit alcohol dehydrogenase family)
MRLKDRIALVTGGGSGIGRAIALRFAQEGARVVVNDLRKDAAEAVADAAGGGALAITADVADSAQVRAMFEEVERVLGWLDILINNAGIGVSSNAESRRVRETSDARIMEMVSGQGIQTHLDVTEHLTDESWHRMIGVHLNGTFFCTREALKLMRRVKGGAIVNLSSVAALRGRDRATTRAKAGSCPSRARWRARWPHRDPCERDLPGLHRHAGDRADVRPPWVGSCPLQAAGAPTRSPPPSSPPTRLVHHRAGSAERGHFTGKGQETLTSIHLRRARPRAR